MVGNFVGTNFHGRPSNLIFVVLNFVTATNPWAWHCCTSDDVIDTHARDLLLLSRTYSTKSTMRIMKISTPRKNTHHMVSYGST